MYRLLWPTMRVRTTGDRLSVWTFFLPVSLQHLYWLCSKTIENILVWILFRDHIYTNYVPSPKCHFVYATLKIKKSKDCGDLWKLLINPMSYVHCVTITSFVYFWRMASCFVAFYSRRVLSSDVLSGLDEVCKGLTKLKASHTRQSLLSVGRHDRRRRPLQVAEFIVFIVFSITERSTSTTQHVTRRTTSNSIEQRTSLWCQQLFYRVLKSFTVTNV